MKKNGIIIVAGGAGTRMETQTPKQFLMLKGKPVLAYPILAFRKVFPDIDIVAALPAAYIELWAELALRHDIPHHKICEGGATRFESVRNALAELDETCRYIAVHDGARPLVSETLIDRVFETVRKHGSAVPVVPVTDSIRSLTETGSYPADRSALRAVQTPQAFRSDIIRASYERAAGNDYPDDASAVESIGYNIMLCAGEKNNIKLTSPVDFVMAEAILAHERK